MDVERIYLVYERLQRKDQPNKYYTAVETEQGISVFICNSCSD